MRLITSALFLTLLLGVASSAQEALTPWNVDTLQHVTTAKISPNGELIAYVVSVRVAGEKGAKSTLHLVPFAGGESKEILTKGAFGQLQWQGDSKSLLYVSRGGEKLASVYRQGIDGGEAQRLFKPRTSVSAFTLNPDGERLVYMGTRPVSSTRKEEVENGFNQIVYEEDWRPVDLFSVDLKTGAHRQIMMTKTPGSPAFSPDGDKLAFWLTPTPLIDDHYMLRRLHVLNLKTGKLTQVGSSEGKVGPFHWSPDGTRIAYVAGRDAHDPKESSVFIANMKGRKNTILTANDYEGHVASVAWESDSSLLLTTNESCEMSLNRQSAKGGDHQLVLKAGAGVWTHTSLSRSTGRIALVGNTSRHPGEVYAFDGSSGTAPRQLTHHNAWLGTAPMGAQSIVSYKARDGMRIDGILIKPVGYKTGEKYPLIVVVHGGPESNLFDGWLTGYSRPGQMAAAQGYMVFHPNYRSSTGRGVKFSQEDQGKLGAAEFDDLVDGVDHLCREGLVDRAKVGITGGSYGGYASAWCATKHSKHFAASVMFVGISNQISKRGTTDIPNEDYLVHWRLRTWDDFQRVLEASPIYHIQHAETPILICHGKDDPRVSVTQSMELYRMLKTKGDVPVRLVLYPGEGHGNRKTPARLDYSLRMMRWFQHYLLGKGGEKPPMSISYSK